MSLDANEYRRIIGNFATGVTVVTTDVEGRLHGMTANAVASVSLEPLLVLVCVDKGAVSHGQMKAASHFGVNILAEAQQDVSNLFASSRDPEPGSLRGVAFRRMASGVPIIDGVVAWLDCRMTQAVEAGDHTIFLGEVLAGAVESEDAPLLYFRGGYCRLG